MADRDRSLRSRLDAAVEKLSPKLPIITLAVVVLLVLLVLVAVPFIRGAREEASAGREQTQQIAISLEVQGCRSSYNAAVVTARYDVDSAENDVEQLTNEGFEANVRGDTARLLQIVDEAPAARARRDDASLAYSEAVAAYADAIRLSNTDTDAFLALCRSSGATTPQKPNTTEEP